MQEKAMIAKDYQILPEQQWCPTWRAFSISHLEKGFEQWMELLNLANS